MKTAWILSVRSKIFFGCISLTAVTIVVGLLSLGSHAKLSTTALGIYDNAFQSMNYLRSAQSILLSISRSVAGDESDKAISIDQLQSAMDALDVARERAMSRQGAQLATQLQAAVSGLQAEFQSPTASPTRRELEAAEQMFDRAVAVYASDGFRLRQSAEALVSATRFHTYGAMLASVLTAFVITLLLSRAIVPSIRQAVKVAAAIAAGKLDNRIEPDSSGETGLLLKALATMQQNLADKIGFIEELMALQASSHDVEIAAQNARFEMALNHMTLGLRMFDAGNNLVVQNRRFAEMFESEDSVSSFENSRLTQLPGRDAALGPSPMSGSFHHLLEDGRTIEVTEEAMPGGGRLVTYDDVTERQRAEAHLSHMARHDALTGLPNRILFREHLQQETQACWRGGVLSVLCLDLDRFKAVNDTLGHPVGDELLRQAAQRLLYATGDDGVVLRLGGDEFAVIQGFGSRKTNSGALALRLIEALSAPFAIDGHHIVIGASVGVAETTDGASTPDELLKNADLALYAAKTAGRGVHRFFEPQMNARVQARRTMEIDLRAAIAERQLILHYQPLVNAKTGAVTSFEALLRWRHPEKGLVSPAEFVPLAEEAGLISEIGLWVLDQACIDATGWPSDIKLAVNLSPLQFQYRDMVADVDAALDRSGLCPTRLDLEITESLILHNSHGTLSALHKLRARGVRISMDDFGTGFSSLSYLRTFPFDKIKIDRSFIRDVVENRDGLAIVQAVIRLGQSLSMTVVAEGVETVEQQDLLCSAGCQELQGFLFSRPVPLSRTSNIIRRYSPDRELGRDAIDHYLHGRGVKSVAR